MKSFGEKNESEDYSSLSLSTFFLFPHSFFASLHIHSFKKLKAAAAALF